MRPSVSPPTEGDDEMDIVCDCGQVLMHFALPTEGEDMPPPTEGGDTDAGVTH